MLIDTVSRQPHECNTDYRCKDEGRKFCLARELLRGLIRDGLICPPCLGAALAKTRVIVSNDIRLSTLCIAKLSVAKVIDVKSAIPEHLL